MRNVADTTQELIEAIQDSNVYREFHSLYSEIEKNPVLLKRVNDYRKRRFEIQVSNTKDYTNLQNELRTEFKDIHSNELTLEFLIAERHFSNMMKQVNHTILDSVNLDIGFLGE